MELSRLISDLFDLDPQAQPLAEALIPPRRSSEDCTTDGCTATCSGCRP
jgi:hypothetical protein